MGVVHENACSTYFILTVSFKNYPLNYLLFKIDFTIDVVGHKHVMVLLKAHFEMSVSWVKNIFIRARINLFAITCSILKIFRKYI